MNLHEVVVFSVDADEVNRSEVEAVEHVQSDLLEISGSFRHCEPVFVMTEISGKNKKTVL